MTTTAYTVTFRWPEWPRATIWAETLREAQDKAARRWGPYQVIMVSERRP